MKRILIVGAGFYGATCAHLLQRAGFACRIIERRPQLAGNCYTEFNAAAQCHEHRYGAHIFHTNSPRIWAFVTQFCEMSTYRHRVLANHAGKLYSLPVNLHTLYEIYGTTTPQAAIRRLEQARQGHTASGNLEQWCLANVGPEIYQLLIEAYSRKQWGRPPAKLPASIIKRLPVRQVFNNDYFEDRFQGIPVGGYTALIENMLTGIPVSLTTDFLADREQWLDQCDHLIYSGPLDAYFDHDEGELEYRTLRLERSLLPIQDFQGTAVINYTAAEVPWTRIIEHRHLQARPPDPQHPAATSTTLITKEFPESWQPGAEPYYPVDFGPSGERASRYRKRAEALAPKVFFGGRLGDFRYYDMHQVIGSAMAFCEKLIAHHGPAA